MPSLVVDQVLSGASLGLNLGLSDLLVLEIGGRQVLYALSRSEGQLVEVDIASDGTLAVAGSLPLTGTFLAGSDPALGAFGEVTGSTALAIAGLSLSSGQMVTLDQNGAVSSQSPLPVAGTLAAPQGVDLGLAKGLVAGRSAASGLDLYVDAGGGYVFVSALEDTTDRYLADVSASVTFQIAGSSMVATTSATEDGLNLARITETSLTQVDTLGADEGLPINSPTEVDIVQRMGETLLVVGAVQTSSISVVRVSADGDLQIADHVLDSPDTYFQGVTALDTITHGDFGFAAAGGAEGGLSLFTLLPGGRLVHLASLADSSSTSLYRVSAIEMQISGDRLGILASSVWEQGITRVGYDLSSLGAVLIAAATGESLTGTVLDDQLIGSDMADILAGGAGEDILADGAGEDILSGGEGGDLFVMHLDGQIDEIVDFDRTEDRLDLSAFDFLYDVSQLTVVPTSDGAVLSYGDEMTVLRTADAAPLVMAELSNRMILNVDRPPLVPFAQELLGSASADTLNGAAGDDTISGAGGDDVLTGQAGDDLIAGGAGNDTLDGGADNDTLRGEAGADTLVGGTDSDLIIGGDGGDLIYGDEYDWLGG